MLNGLLRLPREPIYEQKRQKSFSNLFWNDSKSNRAEAVLEHDENPLISAFRSIESEVGAESNQKLLPTLPKNFFQRYLEPDAHKIRLLGSIRRERIEILNPGWDAIAVLQKLNNSRWINKFLRSVNSKLKSGGLFAGCIESNHQRRHRLLENYPGIIGRFISLFDILLFRIWPKLPFLKRGYFVFTKGRNRAISEAEILGRLISCGFEILEHREEGGLTHFLARKKRESKPVENPTYGPFCALRRVGKGSGLFTVYKLRTMHPYSEFLQDYIYQKNSLQEGGKFKNDFRIPRWGKWLRQLWLDELPMVLNLFRGEMKIVGVRPLSPHYFSLYPADFQKVRREHKPGLLPPFYADLPKTIEEIVESERAYLRAWEKAPWRTDLRYLLHAFWNIFIRRARSG